MALWQRPVRIGLASFTIAFGIAVIFAIQQRPPNENYDPLDRVGADAVIQSRGARIEQTANAVQSLSVKADTQLAYPDGSVKVIGQVRIETPDGLLATTEEASYSDGEDFVTMPFSTEFKRDNFIARADSANYDRQNDIVYLEPNAFVELLNDDTASRARINSHSAVVAQESGYMKFSGSSTVVVDMNRLSGSEILATLNRNDKSKLDAIEIMGDGRIAGISETESNPNELTAPEINVIYGQNTISRAELKGGAAITGRGNNELTAPEINVIYGQNTIEQAELKGGAVITGKEDTVGHLESMKASEIDVTYKDEELDTLSMNGGSALSMHGDQGATGALIEAGAIDITFNQVSNTFRTIQARNNVTVNLPSEETGNQEIAAQVFDMTSEPAPADQDVSEVIRAEFSGPVTYQETQDESAQESAKRLIRSKVLRADLQPGFLGLQAATFENNVELLSGDITGEASTALYDVQAGTFELNASEANGTQPRIIDSRGTLEATSISIDFSGPNVSAVGDIKGVLESPTEPTETPESGNDFTKRPALLQQGPPIYVVAGRFDYDANTSLATYSEAARLWQNLTEFAADTLLLNESTGDVAAEGSVRTQIIMRQQDYTTGDQIETTTSGTGNSFAYIESEKHATYDGGASLSNETFTLSASSINVLLQRDGQTLERIEAANNVELDLDARWVTGSTMTYFDSDGRYEMSGNPVNIVEETEGECRSTTGRTIVFYVTAESVLIDGESEVRTASTNGTCDALRSE